MKPLRVHTTARHLIALLCGNLPPLSGVTDLERGQLSGVTDLERGQLSGAAINAEEGLW